MALTWVQSDLACLKLRIPNVVSAVWFIKAYLVWHISAFFAKKLYAGWAMLPLALALDHYVQGTHWFDGELKWVGKALEVWWAYAFGMSLPRGFPLRLPGEGLVQGATRHRTRCAWIAIFVLLRVLEQFGQLLRSGWAARLLHKAELAASAIGMSACLPRGRTRFTDAGRASLVLMLLHGFALYVFRTPMLLFTVHSLKHFGAVAATCGLMALCALLGVLTTRAAALASTRLRFIAEDRKFLRRHGRSRWVAARVLPLLCVVIGLTLASPDWRPSVLNLARSGRSEQVLSDMNARVAALRKKYPKLSEDQAFEKVRVWLHAKEPDIKLTGSDRQEHRRAAKHQHKHQHKHLQANKTHYANTSTDGFSANTIVSTARKQREKLSKKTSEWHRKHNATTTLTLQRHAQQNHSNVTGKLQHARINTARK